MRHAVWLPSLGERGAATSFASAIIVGRRWRHVRYWASTSGVRAGSQFWRASPAHSWSSGRVPDVNAGALLAFGCAFAYALYQISTRIVREAEPMVSLL